MKDFDEQVRRWVTAAGGVEQLVIFGHEFSDNGKRMEISTDEDFREGSWESRSAVRIYPGRRVILRQNRWFRSEIWTGSC